MEKQVTTHRGGHLEALLNGCPDAILAVNSEGIIVFANKEACKLTERSMNELIGESIVEVYEDIDSAREANRKIYQAGGTIHNMETKTKTKSGKVVPVRVSASHLYDSNGKYIGGVGYFAEYRPWGGAEAQTKARVEELESRMEKMKTVSAPVFELYPGISTMVVTGDLDVERFKDLSANLLGHLEKVKTRVVIVELPANVIDGEKIAKELARTIRTVRLLGVDSIIAEMQASLARAIEPMLPDLGYLKSFNCMDLALEEALKTIGYEIREKH
jgi:PAS domain S-box-containing protein